MALFGAKDTIGLDIGSSHLKVVQLKERKGSYELAALDILPLPPELIVEGSIIDSLRLVEILKEFIKKSKVKTKNTVLGIAGHASVIIRRITVPEMSEEELTESIKFEAEQYVPFDVEDVNIDFQIFGPTDEPGQMEVLLVAVKKDVINEYVSVAKEAGLKPVIVDVNAFALGNMYEVNYPMEPDANAAVVNIGASTLNLVVVKNSLSVFTRDSAVGSNTITEAIQKEFGVSAENAEKLKRGQSVEGVDAERFRSALPTICEELVEEINRSIDFYRSSTFQEDVAEVLISGGGGMLPGLSELLAERLGTRVSVAEPFRSIKVPKKFDQSYIDEIGPMAAVAVGLAVRRLGDR